MKAIKSKKLAACFLLLTPLMVSIAQYDFGPGFIITKTNDTIYGFVDLQTNAKNAWQCNFKTTEKGIIQGFSPDDIIAYRFTDGKYYVAREIKHLGSTRKVFLEYLVDGIADLFYFYDNEQDYYFIEKDSTGLVELSNEPLEINVSKSDQYRTTDGKLYSVESEKYKGVLRYFYQDDPALSSQIDYSRFGNKSLIKITENYHNHVCADQKCIVYEKDLQRVFFIGPKVGYRYSRLNINFSQEYSSDAALEGGIQVRYLPHFMHYRWNLLLDFMYSQAEFQGTFTEHRSSGRMVDYDIQLAFEMLRIPLKIEYTFPLKLLKPTLSLGYDNVFLMHANYSIFSNYLMETELRPFTGGLILGTGFKTDIGKKTQLFFQAEYEYHMPYVQLKSSVDINCWNMHALLLSIGIEYCLY